MKKQKLYSFVTGYAHTEHRILAKDKAEAYELAKRYYGAYKVLKSSFRLVKTYN